MRPSYTQGLSLVGDLQGQMVPQLLAVIQEGKKNSNGCFKCGILDISKDKVHKEDRMLLRLWRLRFHVYALVVKRKNHYHWTNKYSLMRDGEE